MADNILIRVYSVGFGDCIYVRIPDGDESFHMLIDCGTSDAAAVLKGPIDNLRAMLPDAGGKKRLDLLVVTHPHADHIKGFDPSWFAGVQIERIWLGAFFNSEHPQAQKAKAFDTLAHLAARALIGSGLQMAPGVRSLVKLGIRNPDALEALRRKLAQASGTYPRYPLYIARDIAERQSPGERADYGMELQEGISSYRGFREPGTRLRVLAPEWDIDGYYLGKGIASPGKGAPDGRGFDDPFLRRAGLGGDPGSAAPEGLWMAGTAGATPPQPGNVSARDFRILRTGMRYEGLAFFLQDDALKNNTSVVLLLEWRGKRLLFSGDAEWDGGAAQAGERNSNWDVMLHVPQVKEALLQPLDFLKVGHHGSHNGTPFEKGGREEVLEKIVVPGRTQVVVSTIAGEHGEKNPVPYPELMVELGRLAANPRVYLETNDESLKAVPQPQRTDLGSVDVGGGVMAVDIVV